MMNLGGMASVAVNFKGRLHVPSLGPLRPAVRQDCHASPGAQIERRARNRQGPVRFVVGRSTRADRDDDFSVAGPPARDPVSCQSRERLGTEGLTGQAGMTSDRVRLRIDNQVRRIVRATARAIHGKCCRARRDLIALRLRSPMRTPQLRPLSLVKSATGFLRAWHTACSCQVGRTESCTVR